MDSGSVMIDGLLLNEGNEEVRRNLGYLPEMPYLYDRLTGREFLEYLAALRGLDAVKRRIQGFAEELGMSRFLEYEIGGYSKGMKQKISVIAALMHEPSNVLLDEPVWGLDPLTSKTLQRFIVDHQGTMVIATHSSQLVEAVADEVYVLTQGKMAVHGSVEEVSSKYGSVEEAFFQVAG